MNELVESIALAMNDIGEQFDCYDLIVKNIYWIMYGGISKSCVKFDIDRLIAIGLNHCPTHCKSDLRKEIKMGLINMVSSSLTVLFSSIGCDDNFKKTIGKWRSHVPALSWNYFMETYVMCSIIETIY